MSKSNYMDRAVGIIEKLNMFVIDFEEKISITKNKASGIRQQAQNVYSNKVKQSDALLQGSKKKIIQKSTEYVSSLEKVSAQIQQKYDLLRSKDKYFCSFEENNRSLLEHADECCLEDDFLAQIQGLKAKLDKEIEFQLNKNEGAVRAFISYHILSSRKKRYKKIISLKISCERIFSVAKDDINNVTKSLLSECDEKHKKERLQLDSFFASEIKNLEEKTQLEYRQLADEIYDGLDLIFPDREIQSLNDNLEYYEKNHGEICRISEFRESITIAVLEYPVDTYISSSVLRTIVSEKFHCLIKNGIIRIPLICNFNDGMNLYILGKEQDNAKMIGFVHSIMYGFLSFLPVSKLTMTIIDPEGKGNSIRPYLDFYREHNQMFDERIVTTTEAIHSKLLELNDYMDEFIQFKLGNRYDNIYEYNLASKGKQENVRLLVLFSFPQALDARNLDLLLSLLKNGKRCGIYTIICSNIEQRMDSQLNRYENLEDHLDRIEKLSTKIECKNGSHVVRGELCLSDIPMPDSLSVERFFKKYLEVYSEEKKKGISFEEIANRIDYQKADSSFGLKIPIGVGDANKIVTFDIGTGSSHHALIIGATGSGKSTLLHTLITSSMMTYSPSELNLYLMDFKSGTEFKVYEREGLEHIRLIALDALQEFGESIFEELVQEMNKRSLLFKQNGCSNVSEYKTKTRMLMPRILVIIDEFQVLFNDATNRKVAYHCAELANKLVTEGRSFGIHLVMATQTTKVLHELSLSQGTIEQMRIRIGLKCADYDADYLFKNNPEKALALMKGVQGTAVINHEYTENESEGFRVAFCSKLLREKYLCLISESATSSSKHKLRVFEGDRIPYFEENIEKGMEIGSNTKIYFGEPIKVAPPVVLEFDKKKRCNLLIVGSNDDMHKSLQTTILLSLRMHKVEKIYCIDGAIFVHDSDLSAMYELFEEKWDSFSLAKDPLEISTYINEIYTEVINRKQNNVDAPIFVLINNLQWVEIVQKLFKDEDVEDDENDENVEFDFNMRSSKKETLSRKLLKTIEEGSRYGIYFIVSSNDYQTVKESMIYGENIVNKFPLRMVFSLGDNDADYLISGVTVSTLKDNIVYFTDGVKNTFQFKPYKLKDVDNIQKYLD